jgi:ATP-binding cassette subfamily B protein
MDRRREQTSMRRDDRGLFSEGARLIVAYVRTHPKPFVLAVSGAFVYAVASVAVSVALGRVTDRVIRPSFAGGVSTGTVWLGMVAIMALASLRAVSIMLRRYQSGVAGAAVAATLRRQVSDRYRDLSLAFHRATPTGELLAHMEADVEASVDVYYPIPFAVGALLLGLFALGSLILADVFLAAIGLVVIPALVLLNRSFARRMQPPAERALESITDLSAVAHESVDGALIVKTLGREPAEIDRLRSHADDLRRARVETGYLRAAFEPALDALPSLAVILLLAVGAWRVSAGSVTLGTLVQVVTLFGLLSWPMRFVGWILSELPRAVTGHRRIERVLAHPVRVAPPANPRPIPDGPLGVSAEEITYAFDGYPVLEEISLEISPEESVAIVGPTGVGKSTLAQLLVRLDDPAEGAVRIGGVDLREADPASLRRAASIVFQESFLFATSIFENIALDSGADLEEVERAAAITHAHGFIRELGHGYETVVGERGLSLSGGERQRIALARALVRQPRLLILDDATSAVDPSIEAAILASLRATIHTTLVVVAYRLATIRLADRVLYLEGGRLRATGSHEELLATQPGYAAMIRAYERGEVRPR